MGRAKRTSGTAEYPVELLMTPEDTTELAAAAFFESVQRAMTQAKENARRLGGMFDPTATPKVFIHFESPIIPAPKEKSNG